jgi:hypothetical protein
MLVAAPKRRTAHRLRDSGALIGAGAAGALAFTSLVSRVGLCLIPIGNEWEWYVVDCIGSVPFVLGFYAAVRRLLVNAPLPNRASWAFSAFVVGCAIIPNGGALFVVLWGQRLVAIFLSLAVMSQYSAEAVPKED